MTPQAGDIVWATVSDIRGNQKLRPVVVVNVSDNQIDAVAITTSPIDPSDPHYIPLPHHPNGNAVTRLRRLSWAACDWLVTLTEPNIAQIKGHVPASILVEIRHRLRV
jgi:mRNA-degrading endonuclease toxin of MazEF toxin-antitoxin module